MFRNSQRFGHRRRTVRSRRRLLHVPVAVHRVRARLAVRRAGVHHLAGDRHACAQRRHHHPAAAAEGAQGHQGSRRRAAGRLGRRESRRLLADAVRADDRLARVRARTVVLGGQSATARGDVADVDRPVGRRPVPVDVAHQLVAHSGRGVGAVGSDRADRWDHLSGGHPGVGGEPQPARQRGAVHRPQHRRHASRARHRQRRAREGQLRRHQRARPHRRHLTVEGRSPAEARGDDRAVPHRSEPEGRVDDQRRRSRSLRPRRTRAAGVGRSTRARPVGHREQVVAGPASHQHPRVRNRRQRPRDRSAIAGRSIAR